MCGFQEQPRSATAVADSCVAVATAVSAVATAVGRNHHCLFWAFDFHIVEEYFTYVLWRLSGAEAHWQLRLLANPRCSSQV